MRSRFPDPTETWTHDEARWVLDEWRRSGETIAAFARKHGVVAERLYWWRKKLAASRPQHMAMGTLSLIPATIVSTSGSAVTIRLPGEVAIEVANASPSWVAAVVAELTRLS
jgi:transposase-like protein